MFLSSPPQDGPDFDFAPAGSRIRLCRVENLLPGMNINEPSDDSIDGVNLFIYIRCTFRRSPRSPRRAGIKWSCIV